MRVELRAIGRLKSGPERELAQTYVERANAAGRSLGLSFEEREIDPRNLADRSAETRALLSDLDRAMVLALDERGRDMTSREFTDYLTRLRDDGARRLVCLIGGADGHEPALLPAGARMLAFGRATWPHKLVRVMLAEQLYRAVSLLAGSPYHRD